MFEKSVINIFIDNFDVMFIVIGVIVVLIFVLFVVIVGFIVFKKIKR